MTYDGATPTIGILTYAYIQKMDLVQVVPREPQMMSSMDDGQWPDQNWSLFRKFHVESRMMSSMGDGQQTDHTTGRTEKHRP